VQVKEKFGSLRFYYQINRLTEGTESLDRDFSTIGGMVWLAEHMSGKICEYCGTTENVTQDKGGWISTLCERCRKEKEFRNKN
jgi:hypothetical protein